MIASHGAAKNGISINKIGFAIEGGHHGYGYIWEEFIIIFAVPVKQAKIDRPSEGAVEVG